MTLEEIQLMVIKKVSEIAEAVPQPSGKFFYYDETGVLKKAPMTEIYNLVSGSQSLGTITTASTIPAEGNVWAFAAPGTYPNAGNLTVSPNTLGILTRVGGTWSKVEVAMPQSQYNLGILSPASTDKAETGKSISEWVLPRFALKNKIKPANPNLYDLTKSVVGVIGTNGLVTGTSWRTSPFIEWGNLTKVYSGAKTANGDYGSNSVYWFQYDAEQKPIGSRTSSPSLDKIENAVYFRASDSIGTPLMISEYPNNNVPWFDYEGYIDNNETAPAIFKTSGEKNNVILSSSNNLVGLAEIYPKSAVQKSKNGLFFNNNYGLSSLVIPVKPNTQYTRNTNTLYAADYNAVFFLKDKYKTSSITAYADGLTFTTPSDCNYIALSGDFSKGIQVVEGGVINVYYPPKPTLKTATGLPIVLDELSQSIIDYVNLKISEIPKNTEEMDLKKPSKLPSNYGVILDTAEFKAYAPIKSVANNSIDVFPKIVAVGGNVVVYAFNQYTIEISENGFDGLSMQNNGTNPNRIDLITALPNKRPETDAANFQSIHVVPYSRNSPAGQVNDWRVVIITRMGQIYHNKPNRSANGMDVPLAGDFKVFDESVVWDMPHRRLPSKTQNTFPFYLNPAVAEPTYYPKLNSDASFVNTFGNGGFGISRTKDGVNYPRFYYTHMSVDLNPFRTMGGVVIENDKIWIATYNPSGNHATNEVTRICVFSSTDGGREWFAHYEFIGESITGNAIDTSAISGNYTSGSFELLDREIEFAKDGYTPSTLFKVKPAVTITAISKTNPAVVTTSQPHNLPNMGFLAIKRINGQSAPVGFEWMQNNGANENSYGNGIFFAYKKLSETTIELREYIGANNNNLHTRHIHCLNKTKDGVLIGTGEEYYTNGQSAITVDLTGSYPQAHFILIRNDEATKTMTFTKLNSSENGIMRPLGVILENDDDLIFASDSDSATVDVATPNGTVTRGAMGVFRGKLADINDRTKFETVLDAPEVAFFFQKVGDMYLFIGTKGFVGVSSDAVNWQTTESFTTMFKYGGRDYKNRVVVDGMIIYKK